MKTNDPSLQKSVENQGLLHNFAFCLVITLVFHFFFYLNSFMFIWTLSSCCLWTKWINCLFCTGCFLTALNYGIVSINSTSNYSQRTVSQSHLFWSVYLNNTLPQLNPLVHYTYAINYSLEIHWRKYCFSWQCVFLLIDILQYFPFLVFPLISWWSVIS